MIIYFANLIISSKTVNTFPAISIKVFRPEQYSFIRRSIKVAFELIVI